MLNKPHQLNRPKQVKKFILSKRLFNLRKSKIKLGHILFIVENNTVPPDIRVWREAKTAKQAGYNVSVISPANRRFPKRYEVIEHIEIYRYPSLESQGDIGKQVLEYLNAFIWETYLSIKIFIKKRYEIIHSANPPDNIFIIALVLRIFGVKFIFDHHDLSSELYLCKYQGRKDMFYKILNWLEYCSCKAADVIISTNKSFRRYVIEKHGVAKEKIVIIRNDPEIYQQESEAQVQKANHYPIALVYVGAISVQDGVDVLVKIVNILVNDMNIKEINCKVVGDGDRLPAIKQLVKDVGLGRIFKFTGYIYDREMVKRYIHEADICLETAPYNEANRRSTFIKIMEYMLAGKPIVAFDLDETRESVGDTAILIEPGNLRGFADAINELVEDPIKRNTLGDRARDRIIKKLNWQNSSDILKSTYKNLYH